jgi:uncharacterized membrane protein (Fun14 family)
MDPIIVNLLSFGIAFLLGVGIGSLIKWPLRGALAGVGLLLLAYAVISPEGAIALGKEAVRWVAGEALAFMGYPRDWAHLLFTPEWEGVLRRVVGDLVASVQNAPASGARIEALGRDLLGRLDLAFALGVVAGVRR